LYGVGDAARDFTVLDVDGVPHNLTDYRGRVLVLEFFATWCSYCGEQLEELKDLRGRVPGDRVAFLHVDSDDRESRELVADYRDKRDIGWPVVHGGGGVADDYGVQAIPRTFIVDQGGVVRYSHEGVARASSLEGRVADLIPP
jgi:peroxiredoxin